MRYILLGSLTALISFSASAQVCTFDERTLIYSEIKSPGNEYSQDAETKANGKIVAAALIEESFGAKCDVLESSEQSSNTVTKFLITTAVDRFLVTHSYDNEGGFTNDFEVVRVRK